MSPKIINQSRVGGLRLRWIIINQFASRFYRCPLYSRTWLLHFRSLNRRTLACGPSSCSSTSFLTPGTNTPHLTSPLTLPLFDINCPPSSKPISLPPHPPRLRLSWSTGNVFCIMPVLIRLAAAADVVIELTPLEAEVHLFCEQGGKKS